MKLAQGFGSSFEFVENVLLKRILGQSQRANPGSNIDDSCKHRSQVGTVAASVWRTEKHDAAQAWDEPWCKVRRVDYSLEYFAVR